MLVNFDANGARPLSLQIMDEVRRAVVAGTPNAQDPLPSVRELAGDLVVNPRIVSDACQQCEREGRPPRAAGGDAPNHISAVATR